MKNKKGYQPKIIKCRLKTGGKSIDEIRERNKGQGLTYRDFENIQRANEAFDGVVLRSISVSEELSKDTVRPLTDVVTVSPPDTLPFNIEVTYFIPKPSATAAATIRAAADNAVDSYIKWQTERMGRDINPSRLISALMATGVKRVEVTAPTYTEVERGAVAVLSNPPTVLYGGVEDE